MLQYREKAMLFRVVELSVCTALLSGCGGGSTDSSDKGTQSITPISASTSSLTGGAVAASSPSSAPSSAVSASEASSSAQAAGAESTLTVSAASSPPSSSQTEAGAKIATASQKIGATVPATTPVPAPVLTTGVNSSVSNVNSGISSSQVVTSIQTSAAIPLVPEKNPTSTTQDPLLGGTPVSTTNTAPEGTPCRYEAKTSFGGACSALMSAVFADGETIEFANTKVGYLGAISASCQRGTLTWSAGNCTSSATAAKRKSVTSATASDIPPSLADLKVYISKPPYYVDMIDGRKRVLLGIYGSGEDIARTHDFVSPLINPKTGHTDVLTVQTTAVVNGVPTFTNISDTSTPKAGVANTTGRFGLEAEGLRVAYLANDPPSSEKLRTQINAWPIPTRIPLTWDLSVRFAGSKPNEKWPLLKFTASPVLIWQIKSDPGFPPMGILMDTDPENPKALQLTFFQRLKNVSSYTNRWILGGLDPNIFHDIIIQATPDDRETQSGGSGQLKVWVDNHLLVNTSGRNLIPGLPDLNRWNFGLYLTAESAPSPISRFTTWRRARMLSN